MEILEEELNNKEEEKIIKLTYTDEMKEQDLLWQTENEDLDVMERLYKGIIKEAQQKGFKGHYEIYKCNGECICEIYKDIEQYNNNEDSDIIVGYCKPLIEDLEALLNSKSDSNIKK